MILITLIMAISEIMSELTASILFTNSSSTCELIRRLIIVIKKDIPGIVKKNQYPVSCSAPIGFP